MDIHSVIDGKIIRWIRTACEVVFLRVASADEIAIDEIAEGEHAFDGFAAGNGNGVLRE